MNESVQDRKRTLELFRIGRATEWRNRLIWGDKKYVLPSLLPEFAGKVNLIYIDPPFDTGADFSFQVEIDGENFTKEPSVIEMKAYRDTWGRGLDSYLQWFYETVVLLRELLHETGSIYVHLDYNIGHYAKAVMDEVFGMVTFKVNAVAHRDYTLRGSRIQVCLFPDRLEIHTPGGLPPPVTVDNIEDEQATRNEAIVGLLQDFGYMERRGYGFNGIVSAMREAGLSPPLVRDDGSSFGLWLKSHVLMSPEALAWLRQFEGFDLLPQERLALAYLRVNERLYNRDYVRLTGCTSAEATQALRRMVENGLLKMQGTRGGAYYVLPKSLPEPLPTLFDETTTDEERVLTLASQRGSIRRQDVIELLRCDPKTASNLLLRLKRQRRLQQHGKKKGAHYSILDKS